MDAQIALATPGDLPRLREVVKRAHLHAKGLEDCRWLVKATLDGKIVGCAGMEAMGPYAFFRSYAVEKEYRGLHIGSAIWRRCLELCKQAGVHEMYFVTAWYNVPRFKHLGCMPISRSQFPREIRAHWQVSSWEFKLLRPIIRPMMIRLDT